MTLDFNHRNSNERINALINQSIVAKQKPRISSETLGASRLGHACSRALQFEYFNTPKERDFDALALKRFEAGYKFEDLGASWMKSAGFALSTRDTDRDRYYFQVVVGKIQGNVDGIILDGPPEVATYPCLWECKSMESKEWKKFVKEGLRKFKELYYVQVQIAMAYLKADCIGASDVRFDENPCIYMAINKDTEEIYFELVPFDPETAQRSSDKAAQILTACDTHELLPRIASSQDFFECKWCPYTMRCWGLSV